MQLFACKNELDVNADYKETIVIFGLLDINSPKQFIKINKAFLTDQQAVQEVAQLQDSNYFSNLKAELVEERSGNIIPLVMEDISGKKPGLFLNEPNYMYTTTTPLDPLSTYQIRAENLETGTKADARTELVRNAFIFSPTTSLPTDTLFNIGNLPTSIISVFLRAGSNARLYDVVLDFDYEEFSNFDSSNRITKTITWKLVNSKPVSFGGETIKSNLSTQLFFDLLSAQIQPRADWTRRAKKFKVTYVGGGEELRNFISVTKPSIGIVQKQSEYTNVRNGLGVFSSRNIIISRDMVPSSETHSTLSVEPKTSVLGF